MGGLAKDFDWQLVPSPRQNMYRGSSFPEGPALWRCFKPISTIAGPTLVRR